MKNKIIVAVMGGLGNQMFQYSMYLNLVNKYGKDRVGMNREYFNHNQSHNGYELEKVFGIKLDNSAINNAVQINEKPEFFYHEEFFNLPLNDNQKNFFLLGYYQHEKYLMNAEKKLRKDFVFSKNLDKEFAEIIKDMTESNSVALHLRKGDFHAFKMDNSPLSFYEDAIEEMQKSVENPKFFIFSDDINFAKEKFANLPNKVFVTANRGVNSYKDLFLMSKCKNFITAPNSSFSFWAAWLSKNEKKTVLISNSALNFTGFKKWGIDFAVKKENLAKIQKHDGENLSICYALYDETGFNAKYIAASMRSAADNTKAKLNFTILHTDSLKEYAKENFVKLAKDIDASLNFTEINFENKDKNFTDRRKFPENILPLLPQNIKVNDDEKIIFMLTPYIFDKDILEILKEHNLEDKKGIIPIFNKQYENFDFGEPTNELFLKNLSGTPFSDGDMTTRIIKQFTAKENEKVYEIRSVYNSMLKAKHRVFFSTEKRYSDYVKEHLFNAETDKMFIVEGNQINMQEFINTIQSLGEKTFVVLLSEAAFQVGQILKQIGKTDGIDFTDGRSIFTEEEGGYPKTNLNLLFRDV